MHPYTYTLSFRISHPERDLADAYARLGKLQGFTPGRIWKAGESRSTPTGLPLEGKYEVSYCHFKLFDSDSENVQTSEHAGLATTIDRALDILLQEKELLLEISSSGSNLEFFIGWYIGSNSGEMFDLALLQKLTELRIALSFDVYSSEEDSK